MDYSQLFKQNAMQLKDARTRSNEWFQEQAEELYQFQNAKQFIESRYYKNTTSISPGEMVIFSYLPKTRAKLPIWDMYPLVLPFNTFSGGFIGLNFHYLDYRTRVLLFNQLSNFSNNSTLNARTRIRLQWSTIAGVAKFKTAEECVHKYLYSHIKSPIKRIHPKDWVTALTLPFEKFQS